MLEWLKAILAWFKPNWKTLIVLAILFALTLFLPNRFLAAIGMLTWISEHRPLEWGVFGFCALMLVVSGLEAVTEPLLRRYKERKRIRGCLDSLGMDELLILQKYVESDKNSLQWSPMDGTVQRLVDSGILYQSTTVGTAFGFGYSITPLAKPYLERNRFQKHLSRLTAKRR